MPDRKRKKGALKRFFNICPRRHILFLASVLIILLHLLLRNNYSVMSFMAKKAVIPFHRALALLNSNFVFSVAEILIATATILVVLYIVYMLYRLIAKRGKKRTLYKLLFTLLTAVASVYAVFCILWGTYYYGTDFISESGFSDGKVSTEQLEDVTRYFAKLANRYSGKVTRDGEGNYTADYEAVLDKSPEVYRKLEKKYPCFEGPALRAKGILHSRLMSYTDFTGFFFPFTAEANVNTDVPSAYFASTVAHELSHQRGVAPEQEANFAAVLASLEYGDTDYVYSAALLAYCHLGNALHDADYEAWEKIYSSLNDNVRKDFANEREYWQQFETPVQEMSNTVYENFLYSYGQDLGLKSYGACVDLLVNYFYSHDNRIR